MKRCESAGEKNNVTVTMMSQSLSRSCRDRIQLRPRSISWPQQEANAASSWTPRSKRVHQTTRDACHKYIVASSTTTTMISACSYHAVIHIIREAIIPIWCTGPNTGVEGQCQYWWCQLAMKTHSTTAARAGTSSWWCHHRVCPVAYPASTAGGITGIRYHV